MVFLRLLANLRRAWDARRRLAKSHRPALQMLRDRSAASAEQRQRTREDVRALASITPSSGDQALWKRAAFTALITGTLGSHVLPGPLQINHSGGQTTAAANAINERDAAPDAAVRRPPRRARRGRRSHPRPQPNHEAANRRHEAADHSRSVVRQRAASPRSAPQAEK